MSILRLLLDLAALAAAFGFGGRERPLALGGGATFGALLAVAIARKRLALAEEACVLFLVVVLALLGNHP